MNVRLRDAESAGEKRDGGGGETPGEEKARVDGAHIIKAIRKSQIRYSTSYITNMIIPAASPKGVWLSYGRPRVSGYEAG